MPAPRRPPRRRSTVGLAAAALALAWTATSAPAASIVVTSFADEPGSSSNGNCTLREAVRSAQHDVSIDGCTAGDPAPVVDVVQLAAGRYELTVLTGSGDERGDIDVYASTEILGQGSGATTIDANRIDRAIQVQGSDVTLTGLTLEGGRADNGGGLLAGSVEFSAVDLIVRGNEATGGFGGGAYLAQGATLTGQSIWFDDNDAATVGGGLYVIAATANLSDVGFTSNAAGLYGGGLGNQGTVSIDGTFFADNVAGDGGGFSNVADVSLPPVSLTLVDVLAERNVATGSDLGGGGAGFNFEASVTIAGGTFRHNRAFGEGGGALLSKGPLEISASVFSSNVAEDGPPIAGSSPGLGGALLIIDTSVATLSATNLTDNDAAVSGGGLFLDANVEVDLTDVRIERNDCTEEGGGGIATVGDLGLVRTVVSANTAGLYGGGIVASGGSLSIVDSAVSGNTAPSGGGIACYVGTVVSIDGSTLDGNTATSGTGGGVQCDDSQLAISNSTLSGNQAPSGGALSIANGATPVSLVHATLAGNTATAAGDVLFNFGATCAPTSSILDGDCTTGGGGTTASGGDNLEHPGDTCGLGGGDATGVADLGLDILASNGGLTRTHALLPGSPALDTAGPGTCPALDQRDAVRPGARRRGGAACDVGAVEQEAPAPLVFTDGFESANLTGWSASSP